MPIMPIVQRLPKLNTKSIERGFFLRRLAHHWMLTKAKQTREKIDQYLTGKILDIGLGARTVAFTLEHAEFAVNNVDVVDLSLYSDIPPLIYDDKKLKKK